MKKNELVKLKKGLLMLGMAVCLTGCSSNKDNNEEKDTHVILSVGDEKIIFRDCSDDYDIIMNIYLFTGRDRLSIYENKRKINEIYTDNYIKYDGNDANMVELEEKLIEDGAKVYELKK